MAHFMSENIDLYRKAVQMEPTGAVIKPWTLGRGVLCLSLSRVAVLCGIEQVRFLQLLK